MGESLDDMQPCNFIFEISYLLRCPSIECKSEEKPVTEYKSLKALSMCISSTQSFTIATDIAKGILA
jgi:hypothetical protein